MPCQQTLALMMSFLTKNQHHRKRVSYFLKKAIIDAISSLNGKMDAVSLREISALIMPFLSS